MTAQDHPPVTDHDRNLKRQADLWNSFVDSRRGENDIPKKRIAADRGWEPERGKHLINWFESAYQDWRFWTGIALGNQSRPDATETAEERTQPSDIQKRRYKTGAICSPESAGGHIERPKIRWWTMTGSSYRSVEEDEDDMADGNMTWEWDVDENAQPAS